MQASVVIFWKYFVFLQCAAVLSNGSQNWGAKRWLGMFKTPPIFGGGGDIVGGFYYPKGVIHTFFWKNSRRIERRKKKCHRYAATNFGLPSTVKYIKQCCQNFPWFSRYTPTKKRTAIFHLLMAFLFCRKKQLEYIYSMYVPRVFSKHHKF
jgi:hypothetical protein